MKSTQGHVSRVNIHFTLSSTRSGDRGGAGAGGRADRAEEMVGRWVHAYAVWGGVGDRFISD